MYFYFNISFSNFSTQLKLKGCKRNRFSSNIYFVLFCIILVHYFTLLFIFISVTENDFE